METADEVQMFFLKFSSTATLRVKAYIRLCVWYCMQLDSALVITSELQMPASTIGTYVWHHLHFHQCLQWPPPESTVGVWRSYLLTSFIWLLALTEMFSSWQVIAESSGSQVSEYKDCSPISNHKSNCNEDGYLRWEMNDNYFTVGGAYYYVVLNVAFRIKSSQRADLIYNIVNNIKSQLS
jgi:hypothetical protein